MTTSARPVWPRFAAQRRAWAMLGVMMFALLLSGCDAQRPQPVTPALWLVTDMDADRDRAPSRTYLLGTVHVLPRRVHWHHGPLARAVAEADLLITELSPAELARAPAVAAALAPRRTPQPIAQRLAADEQAMLGRFAAQQRLALDGLSGLDDWAVALTLAQASGRAAQLSPGNGVDAQLMRHFRRSGRTVAGLERAEDQFEPMEAMALDDQRVMLRRAIRELPQAPARLRMLVATWSSGDMAALDAVIAEQQTRAPALHQSMLTDRNRRWLDRLDRLHQREGTRLVAVGAAHMVGPDGLPALLAERGYRVTRVQ